MLQWERGYTEVVVLWETKWAGKQAAPPSGWVPFDPLGKGASILPGL